MAKPTDLVWYECSSSGSATVPTGRPLAVHRINYTHGRSEKGLFLNATLTDLLVATRCRVEFTRGRMNAARHNLIGVLDVFRFILRWNAHQCGHAPSIRPTLAAAHNKESWARNEKHLLANVIAIRTDQRSVGHLASNEC